MTKRFIAFQGIILIAVLGFMFSGCENDYPPSLFDPNYTTNAAAVISSVDPSEVALSGVTVITFNGSNFSPVNADNIVYFNSAKGEVLEASETRLVVRAPIYVSDSVAIRISVKGAELFSNRWQYKLEPAQESLLKLTPAEVPYAIAADAEGNVYTSLVVSNAGVGVKKITPAGEMSDYAPRGGETFYSAMKMGPGNVLYCARNLKVIFTIAAEGEKPVVFVASGMGTVYDLDFDINKNIWAVGNNSDIYRVKPDKSITKFPFKATLKSVRVFDNYLYVAGKMDGSDKVWRFPFNGEDIGEAEVYFDFSANVPGDYSVNCITFSADGYMYLGTDAPDAIYLVHPNAATFEPLYPGQFIPNTLLFAWGAGSNLYLTRQATATDQQLIIRVNTQKTSAPYYGIM